MEVKVEGHQSSSLNMTRASNSSSRTTDTLPRMNNNNSHSLKWLENPLTMSLNKLFLEGYKMEWDLLKNSSRNSMDNKSLEVTN